MQMRNLYYVSFIALLLNTTPTLAQNFAPAKSSSSEQIASSQSDNSVSKTVKSQNQSEDLSADKNSSDDVALKNHKEEDDDFFVPENEIGSRLDTPTIDGSVRGGQAVVAVDKDGNMKKVTNIFLFYDSFKINHSFADYTTCDVRFNIISNLDRQLSQLDVKLVWPDITTTLSFSDVPPNTQTYYDYTLLGKGCYSMDKAPNIIVNRCRSKGLTSSECAHKIKWISK